MKVYKLSIYKGNGSGNKLEDLYICDQEYIDINSQKPQIGQTIDYIQTNIKENYKQNPLVKGWSLNCVNFLQSSFFQGQIYKIFVYIDSDQSNKYIISNNQKVVHYKLADIRIEEMDTDNGDISYHELIDKLYSGEQILNVISKQIKLVPFDKISMDNIVLRKHNTYLRV